MSIIQPRFSVNQPPKGGDDYPFLGKSQPISSGIVDMLVQFDPAAHRLPLRVASANLANTATIPPVLQIIDNNGVVVFSTATAVHINRRVWSNRYTVDRWIANDRQLTVVCDIPFAASVTEVGKNGALDPRVCVPILKAVRRIAVFNKGDSNPIANVGVDATLRIKPGYNMRVVATPAVKGSFDGSRVQSRVELAAIAGEGQGPVQNCPEGDEPQPLRSVNLANGVAGRFLLSADSCFRVEPVVTVAENGQSASVSAGQIRIADDCEACCDCEEYLRVYRALDRVDRKMDLSKESVSELIDGYNKIRDWVVSQLDAYAGPVRANIERMGDCHIAIGAGFTNLAKRTEPSISLQIEIEQETAPDTWTPVTIARHALVAARFSQGVDIGNVPLTRVNSNTLRASVGNVIGLETKSLTFSVRVNVSGNVRAKVSVVGRTEFNNKTAAITTHCVATTTTSTTTTAPPTTTST